MNKELRDPQHERLAELGNMLMQSIDVLRGDDDVKAILVLRLGNAGSMYGFGYDDDEDLADDFSQALQHTVEQSGVGNVYIVPLSQN